MLSRAVLQRALALLGMSGCSSILGIGDLQIADGNGPPTNDGPDPPPPLLACKAQRAVHLVAGNGGLAWFTLAWPAPSVIQDFVPTYAYDDPTKAVSVGSVSHPLFARTVGAGQPLWSGTGSSPQPTAFVAGTNQTHTTTPTQSSGGGAEILAAGAVLQVEALAPSLPVLAFTNGNPYGPVPGQPTPVTVGDINAAVTTLVNMGIVTQTVADTQLRPSQAQISAYVPPGAPANVAKMANQLAFAANCFRLGIVGSIMMQAFNDDPHGAFDTNIATARADQLAITLQAFYADLATSNETTCGTGSGPLSLADNTVLLVTGDTTKDSYNRSGWPDGTTGNSNVVYVRSNGFLKAGWFGSVTDTAKVNWDPQTGDLSATGADPLPSVVAATIYAIARGDNLAAQRFTSSQFAGVVNP